MLQHLNHHQLDTLIRSSNRPLMVDVWANWCPPCHALDPIVSDLAAEYDGRVDVIKLDADHAQEWVTQHGVVGLPTLLFFADSEQVYRLMGVQSPRRITSVLDTLLSGSLDDLDKLDRLLGLTQRQWLVVGFGLAILLIVLQSGILR